MEHRGVEYVQKACAYITRNDTELLVFEGPGHDGYQIPKGTVEPGESPNDSLSREVIEESGLATFETQTHLVTDVWQRRFDPPKRYVRSFYHVPVHEPRDSWTHTVTGTGEERGVEFEYSWLDLPTNATFALDLDDYLTALPTGQPTQSAADATAD